MDDGKEMCERIRFKFIDEYKDKKFEDESPDDYCFSTFYKAGLQESIDYAQIIDANKKMENFRFGWIIPLCILVTEDEEIRNNPHLSCYVFLAYQYILKLKDFSDIESNDDFQSIIQTKYTDVCLLITKINSIPENELVRLEIPLAQYGFFKTKNEYANENRPKIERNILYLRLVYDVVDAESKYMDPYFPILMSTYIFETNPIIKFLYLYQVIEVFMNRLVVKKLQELLDDIKGSTGSIREVSDELKGNTEYSMWLQIEEMSGLNSEKFDELKKLCNEFLGRETDLLEKPNCIYKVRNHIIHRFRMVVSQKEKIEEINKYFELYIYRLLIGYKE